MNARTAAAWLISVGPMLAQFKAEDEARAELHSAHVEAYYAAESCECCGTSLRLDQLVRVSQWHHQCWSCYERREIEVEDERVEAFGECYARRVRGPL